MFAFMTMADTSDDAKSKVDIGKEKNDTAKGCSHQPIEPKPIEGFPEFGYFKLQGVLNSRDLGGLPAYKGRTIKKRKLLRSGDLHDATSQDVSQLINMHDMECIIDFRSNAEVEAEPDPMPLLHGVEYKHLPVLPANSIVALAKGRVTGDARLAKEFAGHPYEVITGLYTKAILGEIGMKAYAEFLHTLLHNTKGAVLWHCTQGKDRTGIAAILVEYCLGVSIEDIRRDYLATNLYVKGWMERVSKLLKGKPFAKGIDADLDAYAYANPCYFDAAFKVINATFGSIDNYLTNILDFGPDKQAALREIYLD